MAEYQLKSATFVEATESTRFYWESITLDEMSPDEREGLIHNIILARDALVDIWHATNEHDVKMAQAVKYILDPDRFEKMESNEEYNKQVTKAFEYVREAEEYRKIIAEHREHNAELAAENQSEDVLLATMNEKFGETSK